MGVLDWDMAGPTTSAFELGFLAWTCVPLLRPLPDAWCAHRLQLIATTYAGPTAHQVLAAVFDRTRITIDGIVRAAAAGDLGMQSLMATTGEPEPTRRALVALEQRRPSLEALL